MVDTVDTADGYTTGQASSGTQASGQENGLLIQGESPSLVTMPVSRGVSSRAVSTLLCSQPLCSGLLASRQWEQASGRTLCSVEGGKGSVLVLQRPHKEE